MQDKRAEKVYFSYVEKDGDYYRESRNGEKLHFSGNPKFIVQGLVNKFGKEKGMQVFNDFIEGVRAAQEIEIREGVNAATIVLYRKKSNVYQNKGFVINKEVYDGEEEHKTTGKSAGKKGLRSLF